MKLTCGVDGSERRHRPVVLQNPGSGHVAMTARGEARHVAALPMELVGKRCDRGRHCVSKDAVERSLPVADLASASGPTLGGQRHLKRHRHRHAARSADRLQVPSVRRPTEAQASAARSYRRRDGDAPARAPRSLTPVATWAEIPCRPLAARKEQAEWRLLRRSIAVRHDATWRVACGTRGFVRRSRSAASLSVCKAEAARCSGRGEAADRTRCAALWLRISGGLASFAPHSFPASTALHVAPPRRFVVSQRSSIVMIPAAIVSIQWR